jgi:hypothetical protein
MPIRLNLLAEAQAAEEQRRRDPVKRAIWIAAFLIALMLGWASSLQAKAFWKKQELNKVVSSMNACTNEYRKVIEEKAKIADINRRLVALHSLETNRFLNGNLMNALQQTVMDDIHLSMLKVEQNYTLAEGTKPRTNGTSVIAGKPATSTERIVITVEGADSSPSAGEQVTKFKELLGKHAYFQSVLGQTNQVSLKSLSAPAVSPDTERAVVSFSLESRLPPKTR